MVGNLVAGQYCHAYVAIDSVVYVKHPFDFYMRDMTFYYVK